jgi:glycosyltransferase involved in cell wall biosynthesis
LILGNSKKTIPEEERLLWISWLHMDLILHKTSIVEVLQHLAKRGYSITLFVARSQRPYNNKESKIRTIQVPLRLIPALSSIAFTLIVSLILPYYIIFKRPKYIVTDPNITILGFLFASVLCRLAKVKLVLDVRSTPVEVSGLVNRFLSFFFNLSILVARELFDGMTIITDSMKKEVCNKFNIDRDFPGVWSSGVSETLFDPKRHFFESQQLKASLGLSNKFVVLYHGVFSAKRGLIESIRSMNEFNQYSDLRNYPIVLFLLGNGSAVSALREEVIKNNLQNVVIHDAVDYRKVPEFISMCNVGISPLPNVSDWLYQSPLNVLEYLAMEKPVIATKIPAHTQIMGDNKCVFYTNSSEPCDLAEGILNAYMNQNSLSDFGAKGRQIIEHRYTWDKVAKSLDNYLKTL